MTNPLEELSAVKVDNGLRETTPSGAEVIPVVVNGKPYRSFRITQPGAYDFSEDLQLGRRVLIATEPSSVHKNRSQYVFYGLYEVERLGEKRVLHNVSAARMSGNDGYVYAGDNTGSNLPVVEKPSVVIGDRLPFSMNNWMPVGQVVIVTNERLDPNVAARMRSQEGITQTSFISDLNFDIGFMRMPNRPTLRVSSRKGRAR